MDAIEERLKDCADRISPNLKLTLDTWKYDPINQCLLSTMTSYRLQWEPESQSIVLRDDWETVNTPEYTAKYGSR